MAWTISCAYYLQTCLSNKIRFYLGHVFISHKKANKLYYNNTANTARHFISCMHSYLSHQLSLYLIKLFSGVGAYFSCAGAHLDRPKK